MKLERNTTQEVLLRRKIKNERLENELRKIDLKNIKYISIEKKGKIQHYEVFGHNQVISNGQDIFTAVLHENEKDVADMQLSIHDMRDIFSYEDILFIELY